MDVLTIPDFTENELLLKHKEIMAISFDIFQTEDRARVGRVTTPHGADTPAFMPVGICHGQALSRNRETESQIMPKSYHLYLRLDRNW